jgi:hypothetical protein
MAHAEIKTMKQFLLLLSLVLALASAQAQLTSPSPPPGAPVLVTPTPTATPARTTNPAAPLWYHYTVNLAMVNALGTGGSATLTIDTLPANSVVESYLIKPTAALTGPSATTGTITLRTVTGTLGTAVTMIGVTPGPTVFTFSQAPTAANAYLSAGGALQVTVVSDATGGLAAVTAFTADVWVKVTKLL